MKTSLAVCFGALLVGLGLCVWSKASHPPPIIKVDDDLPPSERLIQIEKEILLGVSGYAELASLHPANPRFEDDIELCTDWMSAMFTRIGPDGKMRSVRHGTDAIYLRIRLQNWPAAYDAPQPVSHLPLRFRAKFRQVYREEMPIHHSVITVEAISDDGVFARRVRDCLAQSPEVLTNEIAALKKAIAVKHEGGGCARRLVAIGEYPPVISALTSSDPDVQQNALMGLLEYMGAPDDDRVRPAVPPLLRLLANPVPYNRYLATLVLERIHLDNDPTFNAIAAATDDADEQTATGAMDTLCAFESHKKEAIELAIKKLSDPRSGLRACTVVALQNLGTGSNPEQKKKIKAAVTGIMADTNKNVRDVAAWLLKTAR